MTNLPSSTPEGSRNVSTEAHNILNIQISFKSDFSFVRSNYFINLTVIYNLILGYCISVWGGAKRKLIEPLFTLQKRSVRFLFGAQADFLEKYKTAARTRPFGQQKLGKDFYQKEHTKPLFIKFNLLTVHNLYKYMAVNEIGKIIVHKTPTILHENITLSRCNNNNLIILPKNSNAANCPIYLAYSFWNMFIKKIGIPILVI